MEPDALWTIKEVAAFFKKKSTRTIDGWCALDGDPLPFIATPGGKMFDPEEVRKWVHRRSFNSVNGTGRREEDNENPEYANDNHAHAHVGLTPKR